MTRHFVKYDRYWRQVDVDTGYRIKRLLPSDARQRSKQVKTEPTENDRRAALFAQMCGGRLEGKYTEETSKCV